MRLGPFTLKPVAVPLSFDTPDLILTGIPVHVPAAGDGILPFGWLSIPTAWDGTTPTLTLSVDTPGTNDPLLIGPLDVADSDEAGGLVQAATLLSLAQWSTAADSGALVLPAATPLYAVVDDGAGGDPGPVTEGNAELVLVLATRAPE